MAAEETDAYPPDLGDELVEIPHGKQTPLRLFWYRFRRNRPAMLGGLILLTMLIVALVCQWIAPYNPNTQDLLSLVHGPSSKHLLGTDDLGRDVLSRILYGDRIAIAASILPVLIATVIGVPLGLISGYFRGIAEDVITRIVDAMQAFPFLVLALALATVLGPGFTNAMIAVGIGFVPGFVRIVRGQVLTVAENEYVLSARAVGTSDTKILLRHILPNSIGPLLVQTSVAMASAILAEAGLSFLGFGVQPPTASWGQMLTVAQQYIMTAPWLAFWPGMAIFLAVLAYNLLGDGIRDGLDPRLG